MEGWVDQTTSWDGSSKSHAQNTLDTFPRNFPVEDVIIFVIVHYCCCYCFFTISSLYFFFKFIHLFGYPSRKCVIKSVSVSVSNGQLVTDLLHFRETGIEHGLFGLFHPTTAAAAASACDAEWNGWHAAIDNILCRLMGVGSKLDDAEKCLRVCEYYRVTVHVSIADWDILQHCMLLFCGLITKKTSCDNLRMW